MFIQAIAAGFVSCVSVLGACAPVPDAAPTLMPCEGTNLIIHGFDSTPGCDMTPPQVLSVTVENIAPWSPVQTDTFYYQCDRSGGVVTDMVGDAWVCTDVDY